MAINAAKQLLDELMGRERDLAPNDKKSGMDWNDSGVCRHFLVNFCPNTLFTNTKADIGPCNLVHDDFLKREYQMKASRKEKMVFEDEFIRFCQSQLNEVERKIKRAKQRLEMSQLEKNSGLNAGNAVLSEENQEKVKVLTERIETLLEQIEQLGCEGKVEEAQGIMKLVDKIKEEKAIIKRDSMPMNHWIQQKAEIGAAQEKQMEVCDVCGAFLIVNDVQQRVDDHLMGKQHMGYGRLKTALDEILERRRLERDRERSAAESRELNTNRTSGPRDDRITSRDDRNNARDERNVPKDDRNNSRDDRNSSRDDRNNSRDDRNSSRDDRTRERSRERSNGRRDNDSVRERARESDSKRHLNSRSRDTKDERSSRHKHKSNRRSRSRSNDRERNGRSSRDRKKPKGLSSPSSK